MKTPIYEVTSNVQVGFIGDTLIGEPEVLAKNMEIHCEAMDLQNNKDEFVAKVSKISQPKKLKNFITIKTESTSNEQALKRNKEAVEYLQQLNERKISDYKLDINNQITNTQRAISNLENFEKINIQNQIKKIKTQELKKIDEKITRLKSQDIIQIQNEINKIKTQELKKIDEKITRLKSQDIQKINRTIKLLKSEKVKQLDAKISFNKNNLKTYNENVNKIYSDIKGTSDSTLLTVSSLQMTNYQNMILNAQNKIEDLKLEKKMILDEKIPELELQKENILNVTIIELERQKENLINFKLKNLEQKIENILNVTIIELERQKENISSDTIRKLQYKLDVELPNKEITLKNKIKQLEFNLSSQNIQNSKVVGDYLVYDYAIKPKKKLIVVVAFISSFIIAIFLAFLLEFIRGNEK